MEEAASDYGGFSLADDELVFVHLLLYGLDMKAPSVADARRWAEHYGIEGRENHIVLVGDPAMLGSATLALVPGLQAVDRDFVLRLDAAGKSPAHDLWTELLPGVRTLLDE